MIVGWNGSGSLDARGISLLSWVVHGLVFNWGQATVGKQDLASWKQMGQLQVRAWVMGVWVFYVPACVQFEEKKGQGFVGSALLFVTFFLALFKRFLCCPHRLMSIQLRWEREMLMMEVSVSGGMGSAELLKVVEKGFGGVLFGISRPRRVREKGHVSFASGRRERVKGKGTRRQWSTGWLQWIDVCAWSHASGRRGWFGSMHVGLQLGHTNLVLRLANLWGLGSSI